MEKWKDIENYPNYEVSSKGEVRNKKTGRVLKNSTATNGYLQIGIRNRNGKKIFLVHRLVAIAFIEQGSYKEVNHKNGDKTDNRAENLNWCTRGENIRHSYDNGLNKGAYGEKARAVKLTEDDVKKIRLHLREGIKQSYLAELYSVSKTTIYEIKTRRTWKHI